jgi:hypothetical protein
MYQISLVATTMITNLPTFKKHKERFQMTTNQFQIKSLLSFVWNKLKIDIDMLIFDVIIIVCVEMFADVTMLVEAKMSSIVGYSTSIDTWKIIFLEETGKNKYFN